MMARGIPLSPVRKIYRGKDAAMCMQDACAPQPRSVSPIL